MSSTHDMREARERMVKTQIAARGIESEAVLEAMRTVPRERFVAPGFEAQAYEDSPLPIGEGQTISQPFVVALMIDAARIGTTDRVLEVGAGSGYAAAVIGGIARETYAIERHEILARHAAQRLAELGYDNVEVKTGDGTLGWAEVAPFDAIVVSAGGTSVPQALKDQLAPGGRLIIPVGHGGPAQSLLRVIRTGPENFSEERLAAVSFVPLVGG